MTRGDWQRLLHIRTYCEATKDQLPWGMIRGMRNSYAEADEKILWETACNDIPKVLAFCRQELGGSQK